MDKYEVVIRPIDGRGRWTMTWNADSFGEAETLTKTMLRDTKVAHYNEIIEINKEWGVDENDDVVRDDGPETAKGGLIGQEPY
jgi:hypothetical protein